MKDIITSRWRPAFSVPSPWELMLLLVLAGAGGAAGWGILTFSPIKVVAVGLGFLCIIIAAWKIDFALAAVVFFLVMLQEAETTPGTLFTLLQELNRPKIPSLLEVLVAVLVVAFSIRCLTGQDGHYSLGRLKPHLGVFLVLFTVALGLGIHGGFHRDIFKEDVKRFILPVLFFVSAVNLLDTRKKIERLLVVVACAMIPKTCFAIYYYLKGLGFPYGDSRVVFLESGDQLLLVTLLVIAVSLVAQRPRGVKTWLLVSGALSPVVFALIFSYRRNALWGAILSLLVLIVLAGRQHRGRLYKVFAVGGVAAMALMFVAPRSGSVSTGEILVKRLASVADKEQSSNVAHMNEWKVTLDDIMDSPFFGLGFGSSHAAIPEFENINRHTVHNAFLMLWMKMGLFALLLFLWCLYRYVRRGITDARSLGDSLHMGLFATIGLWVVAMNVGPSWYYYRETCVTALVMAMVIRLGRMKPVHDARASLRGDMP